MMISKKVQLTYIPSDYWNASISDFKAKSKTKIPKDSDFFILWQPDSKNERELSKHINHLFPSIPTEKLITCKINLAVPNCW